MASTDLSILLPEMAKNLGANLTGIATPDTLAGGPPSADLTCVLPTAKSAICFALALDQDKIERYLKKENHEEHNLNKIRATTLANGIALEMSNFLCQLGYKSVPICSNFQYRNDGDTKYSDRKPLISHRYLAVRSGIGWFGWSGHVITRDYGSAVIFGSVVTEAGLRPTESLLAAENYCNGCRLCRAVCPSGFISPDEITTVRLGGQEFSYAKRGLYTRCGYVCGGIAGLDRSGKWSNWSASRYPIPDDDKDLPRAIERAMPAYQKRTLNDHLFYISFRPGYSLDYSCSHCQLVCHPDPAVRKKRYGMVMNGGVIVQDADGSYLAASPEEALKRLAAMEPERRRLYEPDEIPEK
jgi:epoxyqueuosine reductase QueG